MKADDLRPDLLDHVTHLLIEGKPQTALCDRLDVEAQTLVMRSKERLPSLRGGVAGNRHRVTEKVQVQRAAQSCAYG